MGLFSSLLKFHDQMLFEDDSIAISFCFFIQYRARDHTFWTGQLTTYTCHPFGFVNGDQSAVESFALSTVFCWIIIIMMWELIFYAYYLFFVWCFYTDLEDWRPGIIWKLKWINLGLLLISKMRSHFFPLCFSVRLLDKINDSIG